MAILVKDYMFLFHDSLLFFCYSTTFINVQPSILNIQPTEGLGRACSGSREERGWWIEYELNS